MPCLFCAGIEGRYKPESDTDYVCSRCVQVLLSVDQAHLQRAYLKAIDKGYTNKARAISQGMVTNQRPPKPYQ